MRAIIATFLLILLPQWIMAQQCHVETACVDATIVNITHSEDYNECLQSCQAQTDPQCNYFTYNKSPQTCLMFSNCPSQSSSQCDQDCLSGERTCQEFIECDIPGLCDGVYIGHGSANSSNECLGLCQENLNCTYSTFLSDFNECLLFSDCNSIDDSCSTCVTNSRNCSTSIRSFNLIFVVGSGFSSSNYKTQILDLSGEMRTCPGTTDFPIDRGSISTYINNKMLVCGGFNPSYYRDRCYSYEPQTEQWEESTPMIYERTYARSILLDEESWWITGDYFYNGITTELYFSSNDSFNNYVDLPLERSLHNLVRIDEANIMLLGDQDTTNQTFMFNQETLNWTPMPDTFVRRDQPMAGFVKFSNGSKFVVIAGGVGEVSTEFFSIETQTWQMGPPLPYYQRDGCIAQTDDTFFILGGAYQGGVDILEFDLETEDWIILEEKMKYSTHFATCSWAPEDYVTCT